MSLPFQRYLQRFFVPPKVRWLAIVFLFVVIATLDFFTRPEYILAYLYVLPILISLSFFKPRIAHTLLGISIVATLLNLLWPHMVLGNPVILLNRLLAVVAISVSAFFMLRYMAHHQQVQEQQNALTTARMLAAFREDVTATLTHDLKTPLLGGEKTLEHMRAGSFGPVTTEQQGVLQALIRSNHRQMALVDNLLSAYRNDSVGVHIQKVWVDMDDVIADMVTELQYLALERHISLAYICRRSPPKILGDTSELKRVVANLLHNALNYSPPESRVDVGLVEEGPNLRLTVSDSGPGLPPDDLEKVFHRFYKADNARNIVGTGLGLYLSRQIISAHQGEIWAENLTPKGCRFSIVLPIKGGLS